MGMYDVAIIGGGPSGLHAASLLARKGLNVFVAEKKGEIGSDVICTGIVGKEIFQEFELGLDSVIREIRSAKLVSSSGNTIYYQHPSSFACIVDRQKFDQVLAEDARRSGAEISLGTCVTDVSLDNNHVKVTAQTEGMSTKTISARMAILSTGIESRFNRKLGLGFPQDFLLGAQAEMEIVNGNSATIFFGKSVAPGAFAWAVPTSEGRLRVGLVTSREPRIWFENLIKKFFPEKIADFHLGQIRVKAIAQGLVTKTFGERVIALGEAAGQVKTTTGGGIYFGLLCSRIASEVIHDCYKAGSFDSRSLAAYEKIWREAIQKEILIGHLARKIFSLFTDNQIEKLFELAKSDGILPLIQTNGNFDWQSGLILELAKKVPPLNTFSGIRKKISFFENLLS